jgi:hypothetical protein
LGDRKWDSRIKDVSGQIFFSYLAMNYSRARIDASGKMQSRYCAIYHR